MNRLYSLALATAVAASVSTVAIAQDNLRERARANGGIAEIRVGNEFGATKIDELVARAAIIVHGRIIEVRPHLNANETMVVTDFTISPHRFLKQDPSFVTADRPGPMPPLIVRRGGGTVVEGATRISAIADPFSDEDTPLGAEVVMFLGYDKNEKAFYFTNGPFGMFRVRDGQMFAINHETAARRGDTPMSLGAFLADVATKVASVR